eukprot:TRINITY_DN39787_c0_g1_i1.p1 TRINITY_DN39787_c0_g1~~TRINITY_DN39787_c0_g1_i1.p1  ORF type:complete len:1468 (-),score=429.23 TRINITY_DN39787_c0_g1_i1:137-4402(-)
MAPKADPRSAIENMRAVRGGAKRTEQYEVKEAKKIVDQVTEEEYKEIVAERRAADFIDGEKDLGYADGGKEIWEGEEAARERKRHEAVEKREIEAAKAAADKNKDPVPVQPPSGRGAFMGALRKGANAEVPAQSSSKELSKDMDDMLEQMCGEIETEGANDAAAKRKLDGDAAGGRPAKRQTGKAPPADVPVKMEVDVKQEPTRVQTPVVNAIKMEEDVDMVGVKQEVPIKTEPGVPAASLNDWLGGQGHAEALSTGALQLAKEQDGGLWFFVVDAFEDERASPPRIYLFGKVRVTSAKGGSPEYRSCCLVTEKLERCFHLLLNVEDPDDEVAVKAKAEEADKEFDRLCQQHSPGVKKIRSKLKYRNYAFEKALPTGNGNLPFLKVICDAAAAPPVGLQGMSFCDSFGIQTSLLERLILTKRIMGPSWIRLAPNSFKEDNAKLSSCAVELRITPSSIEFAKSDEDKQRLASTMPSSSPPLRVLSLSMQTLQPSAQQPHEALAIACTLHPNMSPDASDSDKELKQGMGHWAGIRRLESRPFPRDAEKVLAQSKVQSFNNEVALLHGFLNKVQEFDPDVIAGHNAYGFDLEVLANRLHQLKVAQWQKFGRLKRPKDRCPRVEGRQGAGFWVGSNLVAGRLVCDVLLQSRDLLPKLGSYDLPTLAREQLGEGKLVVVEPEQLSEAYSTAGNLAQLSQITLQSALSVARLAHNLQILPLTRQLTNLAGNLWNASLQNKRAERNELLLCHEFHKHKFVLPDKENIAMKKRRLQLAGGSTIASNMDNAEGDDEQAQGSGPRRGKAAYSGGLVLEPKAGLYDDFVMMLDFNSLYPSIIQEHNVCFTTVERLDEIEVSKLSTEAELLASTKLPDGTQESEGILPQVLRRLVESRRTVKSAIKSERDPKKLQMLDIRQKAIKLTANSMYGCLGFQNSRFYAKPLAAMITAKGREALQTTITVVQQELQLDVVYGDTDSVFVNTRTSDYDQAMQAAEQIKRSVNKRYKRLEIEIDAVFVRILLLKKKKYAALKVVDWKTKKYEEEFKGLDIVRRDWCHIAKEMGEVILKNLLGSSNKEESVHWIHQFLADKSAEIDANKVPVEKFIVTKALTKHPKDYPDAKNQPHVQVALRLMERGKAVRPGQEIEYVVCEPTGPEGGKSLLADRARHPHELTLDKTLKLDLAWYKKQQIHPLITRLLTAVEGTSPARIAECLGMDAARFAQAEQAAHGSHDYSEAAGADISAFFDKKARWKDFRSVLPGIKCTKCGETTSWKQLMTPEEPKAGEDADKAKLSRPAPFSCQNCQTQVNPRRAQNLFVVQIRRMLKDHCEGWVQCADDNSGIEKTRRIHRGQNMLSERSVLRELEFALHLCESVLDDATLQGEICAEAADGMKRATSRLMDCSGNNWVDCGQIFGNIFGAPTAGALPITAA